MGQYTPPPGPPPGRSGYSERHAPPPGPPPGYGDNSTGYAAPPGPPPGRRSHVEDYQPPSGPPAGRTNESEQYAPPPGPPPGYSGTSEAPAPPPSYQEWMSVPDTSQLPPPPAINNTFSPTSNADEDDAARAREWCTQRPLMRPQQPTREQHMAGTTGHAILQKPREYKGSLVETQQGVWKGTTKSDCRDACLVTALPMYFAAVDSSNVTNRPAQIYFEVKILSMNRRARGDENSLAIGYCAIPYPTWRMPGWERGSLAVHGDDGRRFVSDNEGGKDFTSPFKDGDTVGLGITFSGRASKGASNGEVFFTRNGHRAGGWNIHEELDAEHNWGIEGLDGAYDLYGCIGLYGAVSFEVILDQRRWLWRA